MVLTSGYLALAQKLQEAADLSANDISARLRDAISDNFRGTGTWGYYIDHFGDGESGDVVYSCDGDTCRTPYEIQSSGGAAKCVIDFTAAKSVVPRTVYEEETDEADHYAAMEESLKAEKLCTTLPLYERFISKAERDKASADDFAGKGKSFPILSKADVSAAVHSIGRAGSGNLGPSGIKARIIAIAKRKGWTSALPKSWQSTDSAESATGHGRSSAAAAGQPGDRRESSSGRSADSERNRSTHEAPTGDSREAGRESGVGSGASGEGAIRGNRNTSQSARSESGTGIRENAHSDSIQLVESGPSFLSEIHIAEASRSSYPVKLISPGTGSTAHYPAAVLERDGPKVFKKGTLMFWNHPTAAEEASRPEGDLNNLAAILTKDAEYQANGPKGPGLYSEAKVMADYAQKIEERAPHIGLSIRAGGSGSGKLVNGKPELSSIDYAESVDYVTRAGRGGMALAEAARGAGIEVEEKTKTGENAMDDKEAKELRESLDQSRTINRLLLGRLLQGDAKEYATELLEAVELPQVSKRRVIESVVNGILPEKDHTLDKEKFREAVNAAVKSEGSYVSQLMGGGDVFGMGTSVPMVESDPVKVKEARERAKLVETDLRESEENVFSVITGGKSDVAKLAAKGRVA